MTTKTTNIIYWVSTIIFAALMIFSAVGGLQPSPQAIQVLHDGLGYPLYFIQFISYAKLLGSIAILIPGLNRIKEWAYAGFTFAWIAAFVAHHAAGDGPKAFMPLVLLILLAVSYVTRPASRRWTTRSERV